MFREEFCLVAGPFRAVNGVIQFRFARLNIDGTLDRSFQPIIADNFSVTTIALAADGASVLIAGDIWSVNGFPRTGLARFFTAPIAGRDYPEIRLVSGRFTRVGFQMLLIAPIGDLAHLEVSTDGLNWVSQAEDSIFNTSESLTGYFYIGGSRLRRFYRAAVRHWH